MLLKLVKKAFGDRGFIVAGCYKNKGSEVFVIRDRRDNFLALVGHSPSGEWHLGRVSTGGKPVLVCNLSDAALSLWLMEVGKI